MVFYAQSTSRTAEQNPSSAKRCLRRVLGISYTEHITNEAVLPTTTKRMKRYEKLLTTVTKENCDGTVT